ncbi:carboxypeptidase-like regulatory domain-containing protein [Wukongibacter baidiensis]
MNKKKRWTSILIILVLVFNVFPVKDIFSHAYEEPTIKIISPTEGEFYDSNDVTFEFDVTGDFGEIEYVLENDSASSSKVKDIKDTLKKKEKVEFENLECGIYKLFVRLYDTEEEYITREVIEFSVNYTQPSISIVSPTNGEVINDNSITIKFNKNGTCEAAEYELKNTDTGEDVHDDLQTTGDEIVYNYLPDGNYELEIDAVDPYGYLYGDDIVNFTIDTDIGENYETPLHSFISPYDGEVFENGEVKVEFDVSGSWAKIKYEIYNLNTRKYVVENEIVSDGEQIHNLPDGEYEIFTDLIDINWEIKGSKEISFKVGGDIEKPSIKLLSPANDEIIDNRPIEVIFEPSGNWKKIKYYIVDNDTNEKVVNKTITSTQKESYKLQEGDYTLYAKIYDMDNDVTDDLEYDFKIRYEKKYKINGFVADEDFKPIENAIVKLASTAYETKTNSEGYFEFEDIPKGDYAVEFKKDGYFEVVRNVRIDEVDEDVYLYIKLEEDDGDNNGNSGNNSYELKVNETKSSRLTEGEEEYFEFEPNKSGTYIIETTGDIDTYGYLLNDDGDIIEENDDYEGDENFRITKDLRENKIYYIKVRGYDDDVSGNYSIVIRYEDDSGDNNGNSGNNSHELKVNETKSSRLTKGEEEYFEFEPNKSGTYIIETTGDIDTYGYLLNDDGDIIEENDDYEGDENFRITKDLRENKIYYIKVRGYDDDVSGNYSIVIRYEDDGGNNSHGLKVNEPKSSRLTEGEEEYFEFEPNRSGTYTIETIGDIDTYGYLLNDDGDIIEENDDYEGDGNFRITKDLRENKIYYIKVRGYDDDVSGNYSIVIRYKDDDPSYEEIMEERLKLITNKEIQYPSDGQVFDKVGNIKINWPNIKGSEQYKVSIRDITDNEVILDKAETTRSYYYTDEDLYNPGHEYEICVVVEFDDPYSFAHFPFTCFSFGEDDEEEKLYKVYGYVRDENDDNIARVKVSIGEKTDYTDENGRYRLFVKTKGLHDVIFTKKDYVTRISKINIQKSVNEVNIDKMHYLRPPAMELDKEVISRIEEIEISQFENESEMDLEDIATDGFEVYLENVFLTNEKTMSFSVDDAYDEVTIKCSSDVKAEEYWFIVINKTQETKYQLLQPGTSFMMTADELGEGEVIIKCASIDENRKLINSDEFHFIFEIGGHEDYDKHSIEKFEELEAEIIEDMNENLNSYNNYRIEANLSLERFREQAKEDMPKLEKAERETVQNALNLFVPTPGEDKERSFISNLLTLKEIVTTLTDVSDETYYLFQELYTYIKYKTLMEHYRKLYCEKLELLSIVQNQLKILKLNKYYNWDSNRL